MKKLERYLRVLRLVEEETEISSELIVSGNKREDVVDARALLIYLLHEEGFYPTQIGSLTGICPRSIPTYITRFRDRRDSKRMLGIYYDNVSKKLRLSGEDSPS